MLIRSLLISLTFSLILLIAATARTPEATPGIGDAVTDHVEWVISLFDGGANDLAVADIEARFDSNFLRLVPPEEFIGTVRQLAGVLGPLELVETQSSPDNEFIGVYRAASGDAVMISLAVDQATGLVAGFFITPAQLPVGDATPAATPDAPMAASPAALPVAQGPVIDNPEAQIAAHRERVEAIREVGEPVSEAVLAGDDAALEP